ncbi:hypothetical protein ACIQUG_33865 [Ensifer sp. NPDC090286]|uniref:hypothetical protein n=1 Tax=Ensifer sp. NPDC090286 TaxID=3363991 RepID=UPI00383AB545
MPEAKDGGWSTYHPSKKLWIWSTVSSSLLTMVVGFTVGGWTTPGGSEVLAEQAVRKARAELISEICVHKFVSAANADENLKELKSKSVWEQDDFIANGGWATVAGLSEPVPKAVDACADALMDLKELPLKGEVRTSS